MSMTTVRDLSLVLDVIREGKWQYTAALYEGWPKKEWQLIPQSLDSSFFDLVRHPVLILG